MEKTAMAKSFKLRLCGVFPSFHSCSSKDPSALPENPVPSLLPLPSKINGGSTPRRSKPHRSSSLRRHVSSAIASVGCCSKSTREDLSDRGGDGAATPKCRKMYNTSVSDTEDEDILPPPPPPPTVEKRRRRKRRGKRQRRKEAARMLRLSTSSADSGFPFSSSGGDSSDPNKFDEKGGGEGETETLVYSSRSFCNDSSSDYSRRRKKKKKKKKVAEEEEEEEAEVEAARLSSVLRRWMPCGVVEGKVRESFAVVKRSADPYEDFKRSMLEMILEKNMFEREELEHLLHCFLSLNAPSHHRLIVAAFSEIWEALFLRSN